MRVRSWAPLGLAALLGAGFAGESVAAGPEYTQVVLPPNYRIDAYELTLAPNMRDVTFSLSRPDAGRPEGDYRVDLFIDGKAAGAKSFSVSK